MNHVTLIGRLTKNPDIRWTQGQEPMCIARYTLAVDRGGKATNGEKQADFISCIAFGKSAEFADKYLQQGVKIAIEGRIQTGSYTNKDGQKVYTTDVVINRHEFCESLGVVENRQQSQPTQAAGQAGTGFDTDWVSVPDSVDDGGLPWN